MPEHNVFVVDDDPSVLASVEVLLRAFGYSTRGFLSAGDLLESADLAGVGCVVSDLEMPGLGGLELECRLRELGSTLAVVLVTGVTELPATLADNGAESLALLKKPYEAAALRNAVERGLERSRDEWRVISSCRSVDSGHSSSNVDWNTKTS